LRVSSFLSVGRTFTVHECDSGADLAIPNHDDARKTRTVKCTVRDH
jgi:hypothetical protein